MWSSQRHVLLPPPILSREPQPQPSAGLGPMASETVAAEAATVSDLLISYRKSLYSEPAGENKSAPAGCPQIRVSPVRLPPPLPAPPAVPAAPLAGCAGSFCLMMLLLNR